MGAFVESVLHDIRRGATLLRRTPIVTIAAALSIALGIGLNSSLYLIADA